MGVIIEQFKLMTITDVIDILIVALAFYKGLSLIKETRAEQLVKGLLLIFIFTKVSFEARLYTINWILTNMLSVGVIAVLIVFQPELRRGLEYFGRTNFLKKSFKEARTDKINAIVEEIVEATASLSRQEIGAIMVLGRKTGLNEFIETGTYIDGHVSSSLLINIFIPNTPLHDGAVIIKDDNIKAAACYLPLTDNKNISKELGTRHRAALGISERSDALVIVVSEETGSISIAEKGELRRHLDKQTLREILLNMNHEKDNVTGFLDRWRNRNGKKEEEKID